MGSELAKDYKEVDVAPVQWDPFRELEGVSDRLNRMLTRPAMRTSNNKEIMIVAAWTPSVDISETDGEFRSRSRSRM